MKLAEAIFNRKDYYITSPFGPRGNAYHFGADYGTNSQKWPQYAIEDGVVQLAGKDSSGGIYALINYPRIKKQMTHGHLSALFVKTGDKVKKGTKIGNTGMTGNATGIHLHLGLQPSGNGPYEDPEKYNYVGNSNSFLPSRGWFQVGDSGTNVEKICAFWRKFFPLATTDKVLGNYFGDNCKKATIYFQKMYGLEADGNIGAITLSKMKTVGFKE